MEENKQIAVVVPTIRPERLEAFKQAWREQFEEYNVHLVVVWDDSKEPLVEHTGYGEQRGVFEQATVNKVMGWKFRGLIYNKTDACRNLGFAYVAKNLPKVEYIISLDDDVTPFADTIGEHIKALESRTSLSWINTVHQFPVRGLPYNTREEAPVMLSHGLWVGVPDVDAPTQLLGRYPQHYSWYKGPIPHGAYFPMCAMNFAFRRAALPYVYQAPMNTQGMDRFADIWAGISMKRAFDKLGWAVVTGMAVVNHRRASNVFTNLRKEAKGIELNEGFWKGEETDPYFTLYASCRNNWAKFIKLCHSK